MGILIYFRKWYQFSESEIEDLTWPRFLNYARGVAIFEEEDWSRINPPPFSDKLASMKFYKRIDKRLQDIWDSMFPRGKGYKEDLRQQMKEFKERSRARKAMGK